ncbi:carbohydrate kinase family protein [Sporomusa aerivorans]|uniref:carbohydrate kinase family protein n=1 Tax=Sporomusa aerivorans TaxID=204936 RepID=UPI00352AAB01
MKFGVIGPISKDTIKWPNGETIAKFGATVYTAIALAKLIQESSDEVVCLSHISLNDLAEVRNLLSHPNIRLSCNADEQTAGTEIELTYVNQQERVSKQTRIMTPISRQEIMTLKDCDCIILMPLNETDIELEHLQQLRQVSTATVFLDLHGLITGVDEQGQRYRKYWEQPAEWLKTIDILKMNEKEATWAAGRPLENFTDHLNFAIDVVKGGLLTCWITFGDQSSLLVWRHGNRKVWATVPVSVTGNVVDTIGCGDSAFGGFVYAYANFHSSLLAVVFGNMVGSVKAATYKTSDFPTRPEVRSMISQHYRDYFHKILDEFLFERHLIIQEIKEE